MMNKMVSILFVFFIFLSVFFTVYAEGFQFGMEGIWYETADGTRLSNGIFNVNYSDFVFGKDGYLVTNKWIAWPDGTCSYGLVDGRAAKNRWVNNVYYVNDNGLIDCATLANPVLLQYSSKPIKNAFMDIEGEAWDDSNGIVNKDQGGGCAGDIENGDWAVYHDVFFGDGVSTFIVNASALHDGGYIELHIDRLNGELIGICKIENTGDLEAWRDFSCDVKNINGVHDLYLIFKGNSGYLFNINFFYFSSPGIQNLRSAYGLIPAVRFNDQNGVVCENDGNNIGYIINNSWVLYKNMDFGGGTEYLAFGASSIQEGGTLEIYLDDLSGPAAGICDVRVSGSWDTYKGLECWFQEISGIHDLYFVFHGGDGYLMKIKDFVFSRK